MNFSDVIGQEHIKAHLQHTIATGRTPHAQLFVGKTGCGLLPMALAYAQALLCNDFKKGDETRANCGARVQAGNHPDLHFVYPVNKNEKGLKNPVSSHFVAEWRRFFIEQPYGSQFQWLQSLGIENKQGNISVHEAADILKILSLKAYEGGYKVIIIWMADAMNTECSNKILKIIEEPPKNTVLLLLTEKEEQILETIRSRCQTLHFPLLSEVQIQQYLVEKQKLKQHKALNISRLSQGDYNKALQLLDEDGDDIQFEKWFLTWVRSAFQAKGNKKAIQQLLSWSDTLAGTGRETQKKFLQYCIEFFRQALLTSYGASPLVLFDAHEATFDLNKFAPFVHQNNIYSIVELLEEATYHIERNGNAKIIFTDLSIQLTRLIHKKE